MTHGGGMRPQLESTHVSVFQFTASGNDMVVKGLSTLNNATAVETVTLTGRSVPVENTSEIATRGGFSNGTK